MCVPWKLNPQPFVLLMQSSTTETQELNIKKKTTHICAFSVQGFLQCFLLLDEVDELENLHSGFWRV